MRRNNLDISADLLTIANAGARKTHLVYKGNLNFKIVKKYLEQLMNNGLLDEKDGTYFTTNEGREYLERYRALSAVSPCEGFVPRIETS